MSPLCVSDASLKGILVCCNLNLTGAVFHLSYKVIRMKPTTSCTFRWGEEVCSCVVCVLGGGVAVHHTVRSSSEGGGLALVSAAGWWCSFELWVFINSDSRAGDAAAV